MGNTRSELLEPVSVDLWWNNDLTQEPQNQQSNPTSSNEDKMAEVRREISSLHEKRLRLIAEKKKEMEGLRQDLARHKKQNRELKDFLKEKGFDPPNHEWDTSTAEVSLQTEAFEVPGINNPLENQEEIQTIKEKNSELLKNIAELQSDLQGANSELAAFENERQEYKTHVIALKDIIAVSKQLLLMREGQIKELSQKVSEIQASLAEKEIKTLAENLRQEYEKQLHNIRQLRALYEERQKTDKIEKDKLKNELEEAQITLKSLETKNSDLEKREEELEKNNSDKYDVIIDLESKLGLTKAECGELKAEMSVINQLFSQILTGFNNGQEVDLDALIKNLEENHALLTDIVVNEESNELSSALPKVLLDLVSQVNKKNNHLVSYPEEATSDESAATALSTIMEESESQNSTQQNSLSSASEIVQNLPKVWKVLTELLSHQTAPISVLNVNNDQTDDTNPCYNSVQTPTGPTLVLSVSKTFIRLKNLIVEKKSLEKETTRLKQLNTHLETRLQDHEKRLEMVSTELSKTWHVVGKMQKQHQQLHTQEKILRYELAQKRKLLNELKEELEYCREKWMQAREKNSTTEEQWKTLRNEFAARKNTVSEDLNNSVESGYSDDRESSSSDEDIEEAASTSSPDVTSSSSGALKCNEDVQEKSRDAISSPDVIASSSSAWKSSEEDNNTETNAEETQTIVDVIHEEIVKIESTVGDCTTENIAELEQDGKVESVEEQRKDELSNSSAGPSKINSISSELSEDLEHAENTVRHDEEGIKEEECESVSSENLPRHIEEETDTSTKQTASIAGTSIASTSTEEVSDLTRSRNWLDQFNDIAKTLELQEAPSTESSIEQEMHQIDTTLTVPSSSTTLVTEDPKIWIDQFKDVAKTLKLLENGDQNASEVQITPSSSLEESTSSQQYSAPLQNQEGSFEETAGSAHSREILKTDLVQSQEIQKDTSTNTSRTHDNVLAAREERLKRLESQAKDLVAQTASTSSRGVEMCTKLDDLHEQYGGERKSKRNDFHEMYKKLEEDILQTIRKTQGGEDYAATSSRTKSTEEALAAREERLKALEKESSKVLNQAAKTSCRSMEISTKLDTLHQHYKDASDNNSQNQPGSIKEEATRVGLDQPSTSAAITSEELLAKREERLQVMEEQAQQLVNKAINNSTRGLNFCSKLNQLHERYGESTASSNDDSVSHPDEAQQGISDDAQLDLEVLNAQRGTEQDEDEVEEEQL